jgi:hypothetical protein
MHLPVRQAAAVAAALALVGLGAPRKPRPRRLGGMRLRLQPLPVPRWRIAPQGASGRCPAVRRPLRRRSAAPGGGPA